MSVDKAKDTSPKKPITENNIVEAKPESSTKTENKPDATPKKGAVREVVGIGRGAFSGNMKVSFQAARSIG